MEAAKNIDLQAKQQLPEGGDVEGKDLLFNENNECEEEIIKSINRQLNEEDSSCEGIVVVESANAEAKVTSKEEEEK